MTTPLVSIIMPTFNQARFIEESLASILTQDYRNVEVIVQDGGSTDETTGILERVAIADDRVRWISTSDAGPAQAINKALHRVRGEYVGWLNSDDIYIQGTISKIVTAFLNHPSWIMLYGEGSHFDEGGRHIGSYPTKHPSAGLKAFRAGCFICQPTVFFKSAMPVLIGPVDDSLKTSFDFEYWLRAFSQFQSRIGFIKTELAKSRLHSGCITQRLRSIVALEGLALEKKYFGEASPHWAVTRLEELAEQYSFAAPEFLRRAIEFLDLAREHLSEGQISSLRQNLEQSNIRWE